MKFCRLFFLLVCLLSVCADDPTAIPSNAPTPTSVPASAKPSVRPTSRAPFISVRPTRTPSKKPVAPIPNIYGKNDMIMLSKDEQQGIVGALTILLFIFMAMEITGPEVLFLIALMIVTLAQILTLTDALSGMSQVKHTTLQ